jgi:hypothetical protein
MIRRYLPLFALLFANACSCDRTGERPAEPNPQSDGGSQGRLPCSDSDGDGFGAHCDRGPDCDDANPRFAENCPDCAANGLEEGCPCAPEFAPTPCYSGPSGTEGVGICAAGEQSCDNGFRTACLGEQTPRDFERCNGRDDDCDAEVDEGALSECGDCDPNCRRARPGDESLPEPDGDRDQGVGQTAEGGIVLNRTQVSQHYLWVANAGEGTVSKVDTRNLREAARYHSVGPNTDQLTAGAHNSPSRTGIDLRGDMIVANRAFSRQPSASKVANLDCIDRNGNGTIETSSDTNGNGTIELADATEFFGASDECFLWTRAVGGVGGTARALAIDAGDDENPFGNVWVGMYSHRQFYGLSGETGELLQAPGLTNPVAVPHSPYGAVVDYFGNVWSGTISHGTIAGFDSRTGRTSPLITPSGVPVGAYGFTLDGNNRLWIGAQGQGVLRFDPHRLPGGGINPDSLNGQGTWRHSDCNGHACYVRGGGADAEGRIWFANNVGAVIGWQVESMAFIGNYPIGGGSATGAGIDFDGFVWGVSGSGYTARVDPDNPADVRRVTVGSSPYTYSDFTGFGLRNFTAPRGQYTVQVEGCGDLATTWEALTIEASTPEFTRIDVRLRVADSAAGLNLPGVVTYGPFAATPELEGRLHDLGAVPDGNFIQVAFTLISSDRDASPTLWDFDLEFHCARGG